MGCPAAGGWMAVLPRKDRKDVPQSCFSFCFWEESAGNLGSLPGVWGLS